MRSGFEGVDDREARVALHAVQARGAWLGAAREDELLDEMQRRGMSREHARRALDRLVAGGEAYPVKDGWRARSYPPGQRRYW